jgi:inositol 1,4,5-triphosphate receptor type 1
VSVLVDVLYRPELLFPAGPEARRKCENGGFIRRLITHTAALLEDKQDRLCVLILQTLRFASPSCQNLLLLFTILSVVL